MGVEEQKLADLRCVPDNPLFLALKKRELDRGDTDAQHNVFDLHHSLTSCGGAQKDCLDVVLRVSGLETLLYRRDDDRHQKASMRS